MRKLPLLALALSLISAGCEAREAESTGANTEAVERLPDATESSLEGAATEFRSRLVRTGGQLKQLKSEESRIVAAWSSEQCDSFQSEVVDLLISLNREYRGAVESIGMERTCGSDARTLTLSGAKYDRYRSGAIGDAELLQ